MEADWFHNRKEWRRKASSVAFSVITFRRFAAPYVMCSRALRAKRRSAASARLSSIISAVCSPVRVRAARSRAKPSAVRGPVLAPPCIRQRPLGMEGARHGVPLRVRAPQKRLGFSSLSDIAPPRIKIRQASGPQ